jgi:hypothetical protein
MSSIPAREQLAEEGFKTQHRFIDIGNLMDPIDISIVVCCVVL